ncbi:hypothetical protein EF847_01680 [Actinobacteria bacterium YIM 96077]|uniref:Uncharacterized protein n=2 Tax=Phytoactinopolyspora halophila TaxID=1981511 RepID=A0A329R4C4_9ACTN|nr:hypothetical protein EF847_01680 [Actinobacteria bacterium YIM 96077]RAW17938.1 hypothetical protein DPM12_03600 [Phytoactinopolyspora halophila]
MALALTTWLFVLRTWDGQQLDWMTFEGLESARRTGAWNDLRDTLSTLRGIALAGLSISAALLVFRRRHWIGAAQIAILVAGASATTFMMNALASSVFRPHSVPVYPSDASVDMLTTLFACAGVALIIAVQPRYRPLVAVVAAIVVTPLTAAQIALYGQRPSPFVTALLVTAAWAGFATATICVARRRRYGAAPRSSMPDRDTTAIGTVVLVLIGTIAAFGSVVLIAQWYRGDLPIGGRYADQMMAFLGAALAIGATGCLSIAASLSIVQAGDDVRTSSGDEPDQTASRDDQEAPT